MAMNPHKFKRMQQKFHAVPFEDGRSGGLIISDPLRPGEAVCFKVDNTWGCPPIGVTSFTPGTSDPKAIPNFPTDDRLMKLRNGINCPDFYASIPGRDVVEWLARPITDKDTFRLQLVKKEELSKLSLPREEYKDIVYVDGIDKDTSKEAIHAYFSRFGHVEYVDMPPPPVWFAFVKFADAELVDKLCAIRHYNFHGRLVEVRKKVMDKTIVRAEKCSICVLLYINQISRPIKIEAQHAAIQEWHKNGIRLVVGAYKPEEVAVLGPLEAMDRLASCYEQDRGTHRLARPSPSTSTHVPATVPEELPSLSPSAGSDSTGDSLNAVLPGQPSSSPPLAARADDESGLLDEATGGAPAPVPAPVATAKKPAHDEDCATKIDMACPVCLCNIKNVALKCGHMYCLDCIKSIQRQNGRCSFCNADFASWITLFHN